MRLHQHSERRGLSITRRSRPNLSREPFILRDDVVRGYVLDLIGKLNLEKPWSVTVEPYKKKRSLSQNSLMWMWINDVADRVQDETGQDADDVHDFFKQKFLKPKVVEIAGETIMKYSTKDLTVPEMITYMDQIYAFVISELGILLPIPEELNRDRR